MFVCMNVCMFDYLELNVGVKYKRFLYFSGLENILHGTECLEMNGMEQFCSTNIVYKSFLIIKRKLSALLLTIVTLMVYFELS